MHCPFSTRRVAARAGVTVGRVSDVLSHPQLVAETTPARVHPAIEVTAIRPYRIAAPAQDGRVSNHARPSSDMTPERG
jgi:DNA-binding LacI/PurR family transcriptional regulator